MRNIIHTSISSGYSSSSLSLGMCSDSPNVTKPISSALATTSFSSPLACEQYCPLWL